MSGRRPKTMDKRKLKRKQRKSDLVARCQENKNKNSGPMVVKTGVGEDTKGIIRIRSMKDAEGHDYIPYCKFSWHQGIIRENANICIRRQCPSYRALYEVTPSFENLNPYDN